VRIPIGAAARTSSQHVGRKHADRRIVVSHRTRPGSRCSHHEVRQRLAPACNGPNIGRPGEIRALVSVSATQGVRAGATQGDSTQSDLIPGVRQPRFRRSSDGGILGIDPIVVLQDPPRRRRAVGRPAGDDP
jgi:hypothetical protein